MLYLKISKMQHQLIQDRNQILSFLDTYQKAPSDFNQETYMMALFHFQYKYNKIYHDYCDSLKIFPANIQKSVQIPHLPISAFKYHEVKTGSFEAEEIFVSSGTTSSTRSRHSIKSLAFYQENTTKIWNQYFKEVSNYCIYALLPGYLERDGSSLISMVNHFISLSPYKQSGFYLRNHQDLYNNLLWAKSHNIPVVLFGVTYALLDFAADYPMSFPDFMLIETGGMKGQRTEISKKELHQILKKAFGTEKIFSEYGMTELQSQAYTTQGTFFSNNILLQVHTRQINDPLSLELPGKSGILAVTDFANIDSCAFILTEDQGICYADGRFEIIGRLTTADIRGCNLLLEEIGK